jgi:hypothetical protein
VADAGVFHLHEDFVGTGLWDGDLFVHGWSAFLFDDLCPLGLWDWGHFGSGGVCEDVKEEEVRGKDRRYRYVRVRVVHKYICIKWEV